MRDHHSLTRQAYVEFDLQAIMDGEQYSEFLLLWLICHQSRVEADKPEECWLETWVDASKDEGVRALDKLRDGVEKSIEHFGSGFLAHRSNTRLKAALESGELDKQEYYRQILRLVYRLIFIFAAEERDALLDPNAAETARDRYQRFYSTRRIRDMADRKRGSKHGDLWRGLALVMEKLDDGEPTLGLPALGSALWGPNACPWLIDAECANEHVLNAFRQLSHIQDGKTRFPVNWRNVGADELGSIYEGLLELHPRMNKEAGIFELDTAAGHERKTTGSYYTPTSLVDCLLDSALDPVLDEACKKPDPEQAVLDLKVCDPACGSGHFLVAAARRIAKRLASVRSGDDEPSPRDVQKALRDVVGRCIYGVDLNPMAVELCKVSLWMEAIEPGRPLSFLDSHIQCGNALLGTTPSLMSRGIPNDAFKPIEGDDKEVAKRLKKRNRDEIKGQTSILGLLGGASGDDYAAVAGKAQALDRADDADIGAVRQKAERWSQLSHSAEYKDAWFRADAWCAAFVWPKQEGELENAAITHDTWRRIEKDVSAAGQVANKTVRELAKDYRFFHWHLAFPQVFGATKSAIEEYETTGWTGGFDCVLGNPPWEKLQSEELQFFAERAPEIANLKGAERKKAIAHLKLSNPTLAHEWAAQRRSDNGAITLLRNGGLYPLTGLGKFNTFALFAELSRSLQETDGYVGCIVPSGIATDDTTKKFFRDLFDRASLVSLFDFENRKKLFPAVDSRMKFCLLTMCGEQSARGSHSEFVFFAQQVADLSDSFRKFQLSGTDIELINPNTRTCPTFQNTRDARLTKAVHMAVPVFLNEAEGVHSPYEPRVWRLFNTTDTSSHFVDGAVPNAIGIVEAKTIHQFDHRFATYNMEAKGLTSSQLSASRKESAQERVRYRFYVERSFFEDAAPREIRDRGWFLTARNICRSTDERTVIAAVVPNGASCEVTPYIECNGDAPVTAALLGVLNSFALDYFARMKVGGTHLSYFILYQLPVLRVTASNTPNERWVVERVVELTYTSWDMSPFAVDCGFEGPPFRWDESRRFLLRSELDAAFFHLYGIERDDVDYIMETFPIVKRKDIQAHGDYRTKLQILEIYDAMQRAIDTGEPYQTLLDPPPADPRCAHSESTRPDWARSES